MLVFDMELVVCFWIWDINWARYFSKGWHCFFVFFFVVVVACEHYLTWSCFFHVFEGNSVSCCSKKAKFNNFGTCVCQTLHQKLCHLQMVPTIPSIAMCINFNSHIYNFNFFNFFFQFSSIWNIQYIHQNTILTRVGHSVSFEPVINPVIRSLPTGSWFYLFLISG